MHIVELSPPSSLSASLRNAPPGPLTVVLHSGVWRERVRVTRPDVTLISEEGAVISYGLSRGAGIDGKAISTGESATFTVAAPSFKATGITFVNSFDHSGAAKWNEEHREEGLRRDLQAVAFRTTFGAERTELRACTISGWQDTLYLDAGVTLLEDCTVKGNVDFIFGAGTALFQGCEIVSLAKGCVTAPSTYEGSEGFVFHDCDFTAAPSVEKNSVYLARPWHPSGALNRSPMALFIDSGTADHIAPSLWADMASVRPDGTQAVWKGSDARFYIFSSARTNITGAEAERILRCVMEKL